MNQDFVDLLRTFIAHDVRFMIVGAYALGVQGRPLATGDLDVWIDPTPENPARVMPRTAWSRANSQTVGIAHLPPEPMDRFGTKRSPPLPATIHRQARL
jgi:hypothetical protein